MDDSKKPPTVIKYNSAVVMTADDAQFVRDAATRIKVRIARTNQDLVDIGVDLIAVKAKIGHGHFLEWIATEFKMSDRAALSLMQVAKTYGGKSEIISDMSATVLYMISAPSTAPEVREAVEKKAVAGAKVSVADVKKLKADLAASRKAVEEIDTIKSTAFAESEKLKDELRRESSRNEALRAEVARLVEERDEADVEPETAINDSLLIMGAIGTIIGQVKAESHAVFWAGFRGPIVGEWSQPYMKQQIEIAIGRLVALKAAIDQPPIVQQPPSKALLPAPNLDMPDIPAGLRRAPPADAPPVA